MNKTNTTIASILLLAMPAFFISPSAAVAKDMFQGMAVNNKNNPGGMNGPGGPNGMRMRPKTVIATSDGGVIIFSGTKLSKYDKDLNLVKEVGIKADAE